tara:strand:- start:1970 stop:2683 length:714 start_codon:yes stop_codon:yes gene_type:complete
VKILAISPTYNEKKNINELIDKISQLKINIDILIVDDNSPDGTAYEVKKIMKFSSEVFLLERSSKLGLGTAYCDGFKWALDRNYDLIIQIDADLSHNPLDIPNLIKKTKTADLVIGSRYCNGVNVINWPIGRLILSYIANLYARLLIQIPIMDLTGGFKCFKKEVIKSIDLDKIKSEGYSFQIEMNFLAWMKKYKIEEYPIVFTDRTVGDSKMNKSIVFEAIFMVPKLLIKRIFNKF